MKTIEGIEIVKAEKKCPERRGNGYTKAVAYVWEEGESILENLTNRHYRPYNIYRTFLEEGFIKAGLDAQTAKRYAEEARWSQKAGCSCGCSPGFKIPGISSFHITISKKKLYVVDKNKEDEWDEEGRSDSLFETKSEYERVNEAWRLTI